MQLHVVTPNANDGEDSERRLPPSVLQISTDDRYKSRFFLPNHCTFAFCSQKTTNRRLAERLDAFIGDYRKFHARSLSPYSDLGKDYAKYALMKSDYWTQREYTPFRLRNEYAPREYTPLILLNEHEPSEYRSYSSSIGRNSLSGECIPFFFHFFFRKIFLCTRNLWNDQTLCAVGNRVKLMLFPSRSTTIMIGHRILACLTIPVSTSDRYSLFSKYG